MIPSRYLVTTVDIADTDEVIAVVGDRLVALQVEEGLPVYVTPLRPIEARPRPAAGAGGGHAASPLLLT